MENKRPPGTAIFCFTTSSINKLTNLWSTLSATESSFLWIMGLIPGSNFHRSPIMRRLKRKVIMRLSCKINTAYLSSWRALGRLICREKNHNKARTNNNLLKTLTGIATTQVWFHSILVARSFTSCRHSRRHNRSTDPRRGGESERDVPLYYN